MPPNREKIYLEFMQKKKRTSFSKFIIAPLVCAVLVIAGAFILLLPSGAPASKQAAVEAGVTYVKQQETRDVSSMEAQRREQVSREALAGMTIWEQLDYFDTYIIGDSRIELFIWCGMNADHVFAEKSSTIKWIADLIDMIATVKPRNLVLSFGLNDLGMYVRDPDNYWETAEEYVVAYKSYIDMIREVSPRTNIYINSIIPATQNGIDIQPRWALAPEWNVALKQYCEEDGVGFIDVDYIQEVYYDFYEDDGVHFYVQAALDDWGESIVEAIEEKEFGG